MDRNSIYVCKEGEPSTFEFDESLPSLPLPSLTNTLLRYYESLKPFGNKEELLNTRKIMTKFNQEVGSKLQKELIKRASEKKNWLESWWDTYGYHCLRFPLHPYTAMSMALKLDCVGVEETEQNCLKNTARILFHTMEYWQLLRLEKMKPASSNGGKQKFSAALHRQFFSTSRVPGELVDKLERYFKPVSEGDTPLHGIICGKGRIFLYDCLNPDGSILSPQQILLILQQVAGALESEGLGDCVPVLTNDERTSWAKNRQRLQEISPKNKDYVQLMESSIVMAVLDQHQPKNHEEVAQQAITGDFHSKWVDRSSISTSFKSGKFALVGEHSAYDGTLSMHFSFFIQLSLLESGEPDWNVESKELLPRVKELRFDLDDTLRSEIKRVMTDCEAMRNDILVTDFTFDAYGKDYLKSLKLHPDSFIQVVIQWTYYLLHEEFAPIYETALMRQYYNGRTETVRSCTMETVDFVKLATDPNASKNSVVEAFRRAVSKHTFLMNEAREGRGVDRHLFGLWCIAKESGIDIPAFFSDPLYTKSGGGGNFVLSTSTLGFTINNGYVGPMVMDGYGVFYSMVSDSIQLYTTVFRGSQKTSAHKFNKQFTELMLLAKELNDGVSSSKL